MLMVFERRFGCRGFVQMSSVLRRQTVIKIQILPAPVVGIHQLLISVWFRISSFWFHPSFLRNLRMHLVSFNTVHPQITQICADDDDEKREKPETTNL